MNCALHFLLLVLLLIVAGNDGIDVVDRKVKTKDDNGSTEVDDQSPGLFGQIVSKSKKSDIPGWNCPYTSRLYEELRMKPKVTYQGGVRKECTAPGCFFMYPPKDEAARKDFFSNHKNRINELQGCRSDIPYLIQRSAATKDRRLRKHLLYLKACFVGNFTVIKKGLNVKKCFEPPKYNFGNVTMTTKATPMDTTATSMKTRRPNIQLDSLSRVVSLAEPKCFYGMHANNVFYVYFGGDSDGRVVCCNNENDETKKFAEKCRKTTELIYEGKQGWRRHGDGN